MPQNMEPALFVGLAIGLLVGVLALNALMVVAARHLTPRRVWEAWLVLGVLLVLAMLNRASPLIEGGRFSLPMSTFMLSAIIFIPTAPAVWAAIWRAAREPRGLFVTDLIITCFALCLAIPLAVFVALIPDAFRFFVEGRGRGL